ncbi:hypothetical protein [Sorangium sp. So ce1335]|uniref:hypothetical protein n=1 Tax=Sorangium sp. So ce1335 TaxID=3133335 RepID=UPI003F627BBD
MTIALPAVVALNAAVSLALLAIAVREQRLDGRRAHRQRPRHATTRGRRPRREREALRLHQHRVGLRTERRPPRGWPPSQRMAVIHHADVAQAVARVLDTASPSHRIYNVVDDEAPDIATLFASVGAAPPDGSAGEAARAFEVLLDGRRIREDLGFKPEFPRLQDAVS